MGAAQYFTKLFLTTLLFSPSSHSKNLSKSEVSTADIHLSQSKIELIIPNSGLYKMKYYNQFTAQNENGRTELGIQKITYHPETSALELLEAYTMIGSKIIAVDKSKISKRKISESKVGLDDYEQLIVPFNSVKTNSSVNYSVMETIKKSLIPGVMFKSFHYGVEFPESNSIVTIVSDKPILISYFDDESLLKISNTNIQNKYIARIETKKSIYSDITKNNYSGNSTGDFPLVMVSTAKDWNEISRILNRKYQQILSQKLPAQFKTIAETAKKMSSDAEKINYVVASVSKFIAYSGDWTTQNNMFYPKGHQMVVRQEKGDCKDFATSIVGILRELGFQSDVAFVRSSDPRNRLFKDVPLDKLIPSTEYFNHAVAYVKLDNRELWLDGTRNSVTGIDYIWDHIAGSPALILDSDVHSLKKVPEKSNLIEISKIDRTVKKISDKKSEWTGTISFEGTMASTFKEILNNYGQKGFEKIIARATLQSSYSNEKGNRVDNINFNPKSNSLSATYNFIGLNPFSSGGKEKPTLDLGVNSSLLDLVSNSEKSQNIYLGPISKNIVTTTYVNYSVEDIVDGSCFILSPWLDFERNITVHGSNVVVIDVTSVKTSHINSKEMSEEEFGFFSSDLSHCYRNAYVSANEFGTKNIISKDNRSPIRKLPMTIDSAERLKKHDVDFGPKDNFYGHQKKRLLSEIYLSKYPNDLEMHAIKANAILGIGYQYAKVFGTTYLETAEKLMEKSLKINPKHINSLKTIAAIHNIQNQSERSLIELTTAYYENPKDPDIMGRMAITYARLKKTKLARQWLDSAIAYAQESNTEDQIWGVVSRVAELLKDTALEIRAQNEITKLNPTSPWAWHNLSLAYYKFKKYDKAIEYSKKALSMMDFGAARSVLGKSLAFQIEDRIKGMDNKDIATDREIENTLLEAHKYDARVETTCNLLTWIYMRRTVIEKESDWLDKADFYLAEYKTRYPNSKAVKDYGSEIHQIKSQLMVYFRSKGVNPSGRWPASFKN